MIGHDPSRTYRAAVIGAGSGGLTVAIGLAGFGHDVVLIEAADVGGDCTNVGCIPSKVLLHATRRAHADPLVWTRSKRDELADREDREMTEDPHIHLVRGWASLTDRTGPHVVRVTIGDTVCEVRAEHVVIAGGSQPMSVDIDGLDPARVITNNELFELTEVPSSLVIVGGGAIAIEMAVAFHALGSRVDVVEVQDRLLASEDPLITEVIERSLTASGVGLHLATTVERVDVRTAQLSNGVTIDGVDRVLMAVGRRPRLDGLGLSEAGVEAVRSGVVTDRWGRTSVDGIWAVGDITGSTLTTHGANAVGRRIVRAIALPKLPKSGRPRAIPNVVYGEPEVASVGMTLAELATVPPRSRLRIVVDYVDVDRGFTDDIDDGRLVVDVERFTGRVLRAAIVGPGASDIIGMFTLAIDQGIGLRKLFGTVHPYPSHAEIVREAADQFAKLTYPNLHTEWFAMARHRLTRSNLRKMRPGAR